MYLEYTDYQRIVGKPAVKEEDFMSVEVYAEAIIDALTFGVIQKRNLMADAGCRDSIKKAMALQIEFMSKESFDTDGKVVSSRSTTVGGVSESVSYDTSKSGVTVNGMVVSQIAASLLAPIRALGRKIC